MENLAATDIQALCTQGVALDQSFQTTLCQVDQIRLGRVGQGKGRRSGNRSGHVGNTVMDDPVDHVSGFSVCGRTTGFNTATLVDSDVDNDGAFRHLGEPFFWHQYRRTVSGDKHCADDEIRFAEPLPESRKEWRNRY